ncbi:EAL domain-containing protein [Aurantivibrio plasticivorans]
MWGTRDPNAATHNLETARFHPHIDRLCLYNTNNKIFTQYIADGSQQADCSETISSQQDSGYNSIRGNNILIIKDIFDNGTYMGKLAITGNLSFVKKQQGLELIAQVIIFGISALICYFAARKLLGNTLKPLAKLNQVALKIIDDPLTKRRAHIENNDEVGDLTQAFNQVLDNLYDENGKLSASEQRFRTLAEHSPIAIYFRDKKHNLIFANKMWHQFTHVSETGELEEFFQYIEPSDRRRYEKLITQQTLAGNQGVIEYKFNHPNDSDKKVLLEYMAPLSDTENSSEVDDITGYIGSVMDITELKSAQVELEKLAFHDPLTNLPNRRFFNDHLNFRLASAKKISTPLAVLLIDLDNFKRVNDSLGHDSGDRLLAIVAQRLRDEVFEEDVVSRMGGDEFIVFLESALTEEMIDSVTQRILHVVTKPINISRHAIEVTCSIGVARFPQDANSAEHLIRNADIALYKAKSMGRNCVAHFSMELDNYVQEKVQLETNLRKAILRDKFELYLQPQFNTRSNCFEWAEALLRWRLDDGSFVAPDRFIPVAEETGLIVKLGDWVFRETCRIIASHRPILSDLSIKGISINLSPRQFYSKNFVNFAKKTIADFDVNAGEIEFEITESILMEDVPEAVLRMRKLHALGFKISIDDFGTGYSSLSYLKNFSIDNLKIDKSFVEELPHNHNDVAITTAVLAMAEKLGFVVIAEGVETQEQSDFLQQQGCYMIQGYLYAKPMPIGELLALPPSLANSQSAQRLEEPRQGKRY